MPITYGPLASTFHQGCDTGVVGESRQVRSLASDSRHVGGTDTPAGAGVGGTGVWRRGGVHVCPGGALGRTTSRPRGGGRSKEARHYPR